MSYALTIKNTPDKGRGVFAEKDFKKGEIVEVCPVVVITEEEYNKLADTIFAYYLYPWKGETSALVLGYGSVYNHSYSPNIDWDQDFKSKSFLYTALEDIKKGDELTVNYNGNAEPNESVDWMNEMPQR